MPVTIILDSPSHHAVPRLLRRSSTLLGAAMVLCGLMTASPILPLGLLAFVSGSTLSDLVDADALVRMLDRAIEVAGNNAAIAGQLPPGRLPAVVLASTVWIVISVFLIVAGFKLLRRHRALVLFLRRFRHHGATQAVSFAVATTIGSGWRLVTLDDGGVEPMGARRSIRAILGVVRRAVVLTRVPAACAYVLPVVAIGLMSLFAIDVVRTVYWRDGALDLARLRLSGRQIGASVMAVLEVVSAEWGVSTDLLVAAGLCVIAALVAVGAFRALRRLRGWRLRARPLSQRAVLFIRRGAPLLIQVLGAIFLVEVGRSVYGAAGALDLGAWIRIAEPYLMVLTELLEQRLPVGLIARTFPGAFALLACIGAVTVLVAVIAVLVMLGSGVLLAPLWFFISSSGKAMERADRNRIAIKSEWDLRTAGANVSAAIRYALAPRLVVLEVWSGIWQRAVRTFLRLSSVSLIDVSDPTDNVLWELELITGSGVPYVAIAEHRRVSELVDAAEGRSGHDPLARKLADLLSGKPVLAYTTDEEGIERFASALRNLLLDASLLAPRPDAGGERRSAFSAGTWS